MSLSPGTRLGPYEIQAALGAGGMGEVYRARDTRLDRAVAIKILPDTLAADPQFRERFDREARAISSLNHPHICTLHDVGRQDGIDFLVMEYLEGETLEDRIRRPEGLRLLGDRLPGEGCGGPSGLPMQEALQIAIQVADALATAHRAGVIHRDLKPGNIFLVGKRGSSGDARRGAPSGAPTAKLLDFGLAKASALAVAGAGQSMLPTTPPTLTGQGGSLDLARLEARGASVPVVPDILTSSSGAVDAVVATGGTLAYVSGGLASVQRILVWVDREGQEASIPVPPRPYTYPRISPDGGRIALFVADQENDIWLWDVARTTLTRATFGPGIDLYPVWTPDGRGLIFSSDGKGSRNLFWQAADGTGTVERLSESGNFQDATAVSPDGTRLLFHETTGTNTGVDLMQFELDETRVSINPGRGQQPVGARRVTPLVQTPFLERNGIVSPDGRWLAYEANDSGQFEIYVRPYPEVSRGVWQVSTGGGNRPLWARTGLELFYLSPSGALMRVGVERGPTWAAGTPTKLLNGDYFSVPGGNSGRTYDISPDGQRFLMIKAGGGANQAAPQIVVVQNWFEELRRLVPVD